MTESDRCCRYDPKKTCRQPKRIGCNFCSQTCQDHSDIQDAINAEWQRFTTQVGIKIARNRMDSDYMFDQCVHQNEILEKLLKDIDRYNISIEKELNNLIVDIQGKNANQSEILKAFANKYSVEDVGTITETHEYFLRMNGGQIEAWCYQFAKEEKK